MQEPNMTEEPTCMTFTSHMIFSEEPLEKSLTNFKRGVLKMPDIVIRGLDMPRPLVGEAGYVDFRVFSDGTAIMASAKPPYYKQFEAVALPEGHGRLVDAREVLEKADKSPWFDGDVSELGLLLGSEATTIVPADDGRPMTAPTEDGETDCHGADGPSQ